MDNLIEVLTLVWLWRQEYSSREALLPTPEQLLAFKNALPGANRLKDATFLRMKAALSKLKNCDPSSLDQLAEQAAVHYLSSHSKTNEQDLVEKAQNISNEQYGTCKSCNSVLSSSNPPMKFSKCLHEPSCCAACYKVAVINVLEHQSKSNSTRVLRCITEGCTTEPTYKDIKNLELEDSLWSIYQRRSRVTHPIPRGHSRGIKLPGM